MATRIYENHPSDHHRCNLIYLQIDTRLDEWPPSCNLIYYSTLMGVKELVFFTIVPLNYAPDQTPGLHYRRRQEEIMS